MRTSLFAVLVGFLGGFWITSSMAARPERAQVQVSARLHCLSITGSTINGLAVVVDKTDVPFSAPADFLSPMIDYRGPATLTIYAAKPVNQGTEAPPKLVGMATSPPPRLALATIELPSSGGEFVLLFGYSGGALKAMKVDFSETAVPQGSYAFWNISRRQLGVSLNPAKALIAPGQMQVVSPGTADRSYLDLRVFDQHEGELRQLFGARHLHRAMHRQLVFMRDVPDSDRVRLKIITQRVFPPQPKPAVVGASR